MKKENKMVYVPPTIKVVKVRESKMLCQSPYGFYSPVTVNDGYGDGEELD